MGKLFKIDGFLPYIIIVLLNSTTDLGHKIVLQNTIFKSCSGSELIILTAIVNALILLPFILLFSPAGFLSDRYPKVQIIKMASFVAIILTSFILLAYIMGWFWVAFGMTLLLAGQSAIYSPAKYGLIKEMLGDKRLMEGNAIVQSVTIVAILAGAVIYSIFFESLLDGSELDKGAILQKIYPLGFALIGASLVEFLLSLQLARKVKVEGDTKPISMEGSLKALKLDRGIWLSVLGLSIFWGISQLVVAIFGEYLKEHMGVESTVIAQGLLSISGVGMIVGSLVVGLVSKRGIEIGVVPLGSLGIALTLLSIAHVGSLWVFGLLFFLYGVCFGLIIVPLNALIQHLAPNEMMGKVLAGSNFMQNLFMFGVLILSALFAHFGLSSEQLFNLVALIAFGSFLYGVIKLPHLTIRFLVKMVFRLKYRVHVQGLEKKPEGGVLLLGNHISFLDWAILQIAYPKQIRFVIERYYYEVWYLKPIFKFFRVIPISTRGGKNALSVVSKALEHGDTVALFPEGNISRNGNLGKFYRGFEIALSNLDRDRVAIIPFYIRGLWEGKFSYASEKLKSRGLRDVGVTFGTPMNPQTGAIEVKQEIFRLSVLEWQSYIGRTPTIPKAWIGEAKRVGGELAVADSTGVELSGYRFITAVLLMRGVFKRVLKDTQNIGLIVPTSAGGAIANMAVLALGKRVVNLNYSSGVQSLNFSIELAEIRYIVTSRRFLTRLQAKGFNLDEILKKVEVIYLEDIKANFGKGTQLLTFAMAKLLPTQLLSYLFIANGDNGDTAVIMFSSGSEGSPKGIELNHMNIMGNIKQIISILNPSESDVMLGTLPIFHSFGFTVTTLLPLIEGIPLVCHPDPTDGYGIAKLSFKYSGTILFATPTLYQLYAKNRKIHPAMFETLQMVVAGAEKLPNEVRELFKIRFGKDILEGYGTTETSPVASCNLHDRLDPKDFHIQIGNRVGTVGLPIVGTSFKIVDPNSFKPLPVGEDGMILVGGVQVMQGYLKNRTKTDEVIREIDGVRWYITGDKGHLDSDGFLTIIDRYSRFTKIGGEMISLGFIEGEINRALDEHSRVAVTAIPDTKKGERLVLLLEGEMELETLKEILKGLKLNPLYTPNSHFKVDAIPKLGSGKIDLKGLKQMAIDLNSQLGVTDC